MSLLIGKKFAKPSWENFMLTWRHGNMKLVGKGGNWVKKVPFQNVREDGRPVIQGGISRV